MIALLAFFVALSILVAIMVRLSLPLRSTSAPPVLYDRESRRYHEHHARRAQGLPCEHEWMDLPHDPPGYRAPCMFCDELKPLATDPEHAGKNKETKP